MGNRKIGNAHVSLAAGKMSNVEPANVQKRLNFVPFALLRKMGVCSEYFKIAFKMMKV